MQRDERAAVDARKAAVAARNNADWCDLVCRAHGIDTSFDRDAWWAHRRTPPYYPDAVTLRPHLAAGDLLPRIDASPGCSIKDSFADLDLSGAGFRILFEAEWIYREPSPRRATSGWAEVRTLDEWPGASIHPAVLDDPAVAVLLARDGHGPVAGVIANRSAGAVGLSNVFTRGGTPDEPRDGAWDEAWVGAGAAAGTRFPGLPLVGYERGESLRAALRAGFASVGALRVWIRP